MTSLIYHTRMGIWWSLILYLCIAVNILKALDINQFYNFGASAGDTNIANINLTNTDDSSSNLITLSTSFPFYGTSYTKLYVNTNGILSFNIPYTVITPVRFPIATYALIAVFWVDIDIRNGGYIWYRKTTDVSTLQTATTEIRTHLTDISSFQATMVFIATWEDVAFFGASTVGKNKRNTFQVVLITNGTISFVMYHYSKIQWFGNGNSDTGLSGTPAAVGFNAGDNVRHHVISESMTSDVLYLPSRSNVNIAGKFVFDITEKVCGNVPDVHNGIWRATGYNIGSQAQLMCENGYLAIGDNVSYCNSNGRWTNNNGRCEKLCENVPDVENGLWNASGIIAGSEAQLTCEDGYLAVGDNVSYCNTNGSWTKINGSCEKLCDEVPDVENGVWNAFGIIDGSDAHLTCEDGYLAIGDNVSYCNSNGSWTNNNGRCEKLCENVPDVKNGLWNASGIIAGSEAQLTCEDGYLAVGDNVSYCNSNGSWTKINGSCEKLCDEVPDVENGVWNAFGILDGSEAHLTCEDGYLAIDDNVSYCNSNGSWTNNNGRCEKLCENVPDVKNGLWNASGIIAGSEAQLTCEDGYLAVGDNVSYCNSNGTWTKIHGSCEKLCEDIPSFENGVWNTFGNIAGSEAQLTCENGYYLVGDNSSFCSSNGSWTIVNGHCIKICNQLPKLNNGNWNVTYSSKGASASLICRIGFIPNVSTIALCNKDGEWLNTSVSCKRENCTTNEDCRYVNHTYCDIVTSSCKCILGRTGIACEDEIICQNNSDCSNVNNSYCDLKNSTCQCKSGLTGNICQNQTIQYQLSEGEKKSTVELVFSVTVAGDVEDQNSKFYRKLSSAFKLMLDVFYRQELPSSIYSTVVILYIRRGSLIVTHDVITKDALGVDVETSIKESLADVVSGKRIITYKNQTLPVASATKDGTTSTYVKCSVVLITI